MDSLRELLKEQNTLLRAVLAEQNKPFTGFSDRPPRQPQWVFVGRNADSCWYTLDKDGQQVPIPQRALTGYIWALSFEKVERRGKECHKLNVTVRTDDQIYIVSSGHDTCFSKSLIATIVVMKPEQLRASVTVAVAPGEDESVVWARLYAPDYIKAPTWDEHADWRAVASKAIATVQEAVATRDRRGFLF